MDGCVWWDILFLYNRYCEGDDECCVGAAEADEGPVGFEEGWVPWRTRFARHSSGDFWGVTEMPSYLY